MTSLWPGRRRLRADSGFSLIESVVALGIASTLFLSLATATIFAMRTSLIGRSQQQAADFMTRAVEKARLVDFGSLGNDASDLAGDGRLTSCGGGKCFDPGTGTAEKVHTLTGASINPHITTPNLASESNNVTFKVATYVTEPVGMDPTESLRVTSVVTWKVGTTTRSKQTSTIVSYAQRGLPLPSFKLDPFTALSPGAKAPGSLFTYGFKLVNQGAPDRWNITVSGAGAGLPWKLYLDSDNDADGYNPATDTVLMTDSTSDGIVDTGRIDPSSSFSFWLVFLSSSTATDSTTTTTVTATSVAQPAAGSAAKSQTVTTQISSSGSTPTASSPPPTTSAAPTDCGWALTTPILAIPTQSPALTKTTFSLHNGTSGVASGDTTAQSTSYMNGTSAYASTLSQYSTDINSYSGRTLNTLSSGDLTAPLSITDARKFADWQTTTFKNSTTVAATTAVFKVYVGGVGGSLSGLSLRLYVYDASTSKTSITYADFSAGTVCTGFATIYLSLSVPSTTLAKNHALGVRLVNTGSSPVRIAYDTSGAYDATFGIGVK